MSQLLFRLFFLVLGAFLPEYLETVYSGYELNLFGLWHHVLVDLNREKRYHEQDAREGTSKERPIDVGVLLFRNVDFLAPRAVNFSS